MQLPDKLFGRVYSPRQRPLKATLKHLWKADLPLPPSAYNVDDAIGLQFPARMYVNDVDGDCVIAARANQQTRFVARATGAIPLISDTEVLTEYFDESGGADVGLVPENSLALWQSRGWTAAGTNHRIAAWGRVDAADVLDVQRCIWLLDGMQLGMALPSAWSDALNAGRPWDAPADPGAQGWAPGSWGGHQVYCYKYDADGVWCWTWGQPQLITWAGLAWAGAEENMGEAEGVVRAAEPGEQNLDLQRLQNELAEIGAQ